MLQIKKTVLPKEAELTYNEWIAYIRNECNKIRREKGLEEVAHFVGGQGKRLNEIQKSLKRIRYDFSTN